MVTGNGIAGLSMNADFFVTGSKRKASGVETTTSSLSQSYFMGFDKKLTNTIGFNGDMRVSTSKNDSSSSGSSERTTVRPSLFANLNTDYFRLNLGYQSNFLPFWAIEDDTVHTDTWNTDFSTSPEGFPSLRLSLSQSKSQDTIDQTSTDRKQTSMSANTNYSIFGANLLYNFSRSEDIDKVAETKQTSPRHIASLDYSNAFLNKKINYSFNLGGSRSTSINESTSGTATTFFEQVAIAGGLFAVDGTPADGELSENTSLVDGNTGTSAGIDLNSNDRNIGFKLDNAQKIFKIYLFVSTTEEDIADFDFNWAVYFSDDTITATTWTSMSRTITFDEATNRFEFTISFPVSAKFFKVVNTNPNVLAETINITEIEALKSVTSTPTTIIESNTNRFFGGANMSWRLTKKINASYNVNYDQSKESLRNTKNKNLSQGLSLSYAFSKKLTFFTGYQNQRSEITGNQKTGSNSYMFSMSSNPIETVNGTMSVNRTETVEGGSTTSKSNSISTNGFYQIYPGITLGTSLNWNISESKGTESQTKSTTWNLNLKPRKSLNIVMDGSLSQATSKSSTTSTSSLTKNLRSAINFNPSRHISFSANMEHLPETKQNFSINTRLPGVLNLNFTYSRSDAGVQTTGTNMTWNVSRFIFLTASYRKTFVGNEAGDTASSYNLSLSIRK